MENGQAVLTGAYVDLTDVVAAPPSTGPAPQPAATPQKVKLRNSTVSSRENRVVFVGQSSIYISTHIHTACTHTDSHNHTHGHTNTYTLHAHTHTHARARARTNTPHFDIMSRYTILLLVTWCV